MLGQNDGDDLRIIIIIIIIIVIIAQDITIYISTYAQRSRLPERHFRGYKNKIKLEDPSQGSKLLFGPSITNAALLGS